MTKTKIWFRSLRAYAYSASVIPVLAGTALAYVNPVNVKWVFLPFIFFGVVCLHTGTNLINDYYDYIHGIDTTQTQGSSGVLTHNLLRPEQIKKAGFWFFFAGIIFAIPLIIEHGYPIIILGLTGVLGGYLYTGGPKGYKYFALGDIGVFVLMGPLIVVGAYYGLTGKLSFQAAYISIPIGLLVASILHSNNMRDMQDDKSKNVKTVSIILGLKLSKIMFFIYIIGAYVSIIVMIYFNILSLYSLGVFLTLPLAIKLLIITYKYDGKQKLPGFVELTSMFHLLFGLILCISIFFINRT